MLRKRKKKKEEEENRERWVVSYADFITLLFALFTTLYAISTMDAQRAKQMVHSIEQSFDAKIFDPGSKQLALDHGPNGNGDAFSKKIILSREAMQSLQKSIEAILGLDEMKSSVHVSLDPRGLIISLGEGGFFDSGSEKIKPEGRMLLNRIANKLISTGNMMRIEGHTDTDPIQTSKFPSNWELSTMRAREIQKYLIEEFGFRDEKLSLAGYGEYRPVAPNDSPEGKARNRRVDIVILDPDIALMEPVCDISALENPK